MSKQQEQHNSSSSDGSSSSRRSSGQQPAGFFEFEESAATPALPPSPVLRPAGSEGAVGDPPHETRAAAGGTGGAVGAAVAALHSGGSRLIVYGLGGLPSLDEAAHRHICSLSIQFVSASYLSKRLQLGSRMRRRFPALTALCLSNNRLRTVSELSSLLTPFLCPAEAWCVYRQSDMRALILYVSLSRACFQG